MKRPLTILIAALIALCANAGNYPDRVDYLWVTVPDHADWLYRTGENATVEIQFYKYGIPRDCTVDYKLAGDRLAPDKSGSLVLKGGRGKLNIGSRKTPGFRDLQLSTEVDGVKYEHHIKLGFSVDRIEPFTKEPKDFTQYWENTIKEAERFPLTYTRELAPEYCTDKINCYLVRLMLNSTQSVFAYLFYPKNAQKGSCPAVLCPPGAGIKTIRTPMRHKYYAEQGCIRMEMEIHGLDPRLPEETFNEISAAFNGKENGYLSNGLEDRDRYYMRRVYVSLVRAIDLLTSLPEWDGKNMVVQGGSQGGGLSLVAAGLDRRVTLCIANHPALADMAAYSEEGRTGGYPHFNRIPGFFTDNIIRNLAYYDVVNFARHISCKVRMTWGYNDNVCPPTTSYAVWNSLNCPKEALITPVNEHWTSEATEREHLEWMLKNLN